MHGQKNIKLSGDLCRLVPFSERQERLAADLPSLVILLGIGCGSLETSALTERRGRNILQDMNQQRHCGNKSRTAQPGDKINSLCVLFDMPISLLES